MHSFLRSRPLLTMAALLLPLGCTAPDRPEPAAPPPGFSLRDVGGAEHHPFAEADVRAVTLLFVLADCPIANGYAPQINRLAQEYGPRGVRFFLVQVDPDTSAEQAGKHAR